MAVYRGPYVSLDLTKEGVWLDMERDELGNTRYWMTIEGKEIELTKRQHQVLIEQRAEARKSAIQEAEDRIIKLLESKLCPCVESDTFPSPDDSREELMKHMNCSWEAMMIEYHVALIKGEQK